MINGKLYMSGGRTNPDEVLSNTWGYDIATNAWTTADQLVDMPMAKNTAGRAVVQGQLYAIGGTNMPSFDGLNDVSKYDVATNTWSPAPTLIAARSFTASVAVGNTIIAAGGRANVTPRSPPSRSSCWAGHHRHRLRHHLRLRRRRHRHLRHLRHHRRRLRHHHRLRHHLRLRLRLRHLRLAAACRG